MGRQQGIAAVLVKPGDFKTNMSDIDGAPSDLTPVIKCVRDAVMSARPLARYYTGKVVLGGFSVGFLSRLMSVLPDSLADKLKSWWLWEATLCPCTLHKLHVHTFLVCKQNMHAAWWLLAAGCWLPIACLFVRSG